MMRCLASAGDELLDLMDRGKDRLTIAVWAQCPVQEQLL